MVTDVIPPPRFLPSIFIAHRVQQSHCSSIVHRVLLSHALALSASQFVHKKKSQRIYTSMHSAGLELTKLTYTRLEDNLIRHRGDRYILYVPGIILVCCTRHASPTTKNHKHTDDSILRLLCARQSSSSHKRDSSSTTTIETTTGTPHQHHSSSAAEETAAEAVVT